MKIGLSMGSALPMRHPDAILAGSSRWEVPLVGEITSDQVQIGPQNCALGLILDEEYLDRLQEAHPATQFRLHANVRLLDRPCGFDLASMGMFPEYRKRLVAMLRHLGQPYTIHAGRRANQVGLEAQISRCKALEQDVGLPVGIEGLYPDARDGNTCSTWQDYKRVLESGVHYAVDLSHLNIVREQTGEAPAGLVQALIESDGCMEIHLSGNDGTADRHLAIEEKPFWWEPFFAANIRADVFYEGRIH